MTNMQVRDVPPEIYEALRSEARAEGKSLQQHLLAVLDEHTTRTRRQALFRRLDDVLGDEPVLAADPADAVRADRDERESRDNTRAEDYE